MPMKRKNKAPWAGDLGVNQLWYTKNNKRQRNRNKIAKASRKKNRGRK